MIHTIASCVAVFAASAAVVWLAFKTEPPSRRLQDWATVALVTWFMLGFVFVFLGDDEVRHLHRVYNLQPNRLSVHVMAVLSGLVLALRMVDSDFITDMRDPRSSGWNPLIVLLSPLMAILMIGVAVNEAVYMLVAGSWRGFASLTAFALIVVSFLVIVAISIRREAFGERAER